MYFKPNFKNEISLTISIQLQTFTSRVEKAKLPNVLFVYLRLFLNTFLFRKWGSHLKVQMPSTRLEVCESTIDAPMTRNLDHPRACLDIEQHNIFAGNGTRYHNVTAS